jgi:hypothetical protein
MILKRVPPELSDNVLEVNMFGPDDHQAVLYCYQAPKASVSISNASNSIVGRY